MPTTTPPITVFTKPWQNLEIDDLAELVAELGFDGIELPVRPGFQVEPETIEISLSNAVRVFKNKGLMIYSVAGDFDHRTAVACAEAGVPVLRTMLKLSPDMSYMESVEAFRGDARSIGKALVGSGTTIGLQNHCDEFVTSSIGIIHAIEHLAADEVSAVLDLGHTGLDGEMEEIAIDIAWSRLSMINLKNAIRIEDGIDSNGAIQWNRTWVAGREGFTSWDKVVAELNKRSYKFPICLTAEYKDESLNPLVGKAVIPPLKDDLAFLKKLLNRH
jgi:sugar phosphate isomerase/epimerase